MIKFGGLETLDWIRVARRRNVRKGFGDLTERRILRIWVLDLAMDSG
jgi:hypothetical protein